MEKLAFWSIYYVRTNEFEQLFISALIASHVFGIGFLKMVKNYCTEKKRVNYLIEYRSQFYLGFN